MCKLTLLIFMTTNCEMELGLLKTVIKSNHIVCISLHSLVIRYSINSGYFMWVFVVNGLFA